MNYTKGEWKVTEAGGIFVDSELTAQVIAICWKPGFILPAAEGKANANLIAAAPDMYEALKYIDELFLTPELNLPVPKLHIVLIKIQDALAKAEGRKV